MQKIDFKKTYKHLYNPSAKEFSLVEVPPMQFLMIDGHGDPNTARGYVTAVETLYAAAYKIKFASKQKLEMDYTVPPLEGLWWAEDMETFTVSRDKSAWDWTMMIMPSLPSIRLESYNEGTAVQILHIGPYDDEGPVLRKMHMEYIPENGYTISGKHHEVYLSDPRKVPPEKLKTVLRQPVERS